MHGHGKLFLLFKKCLQEVTSLCPPFLRGCCHICIGHLKLLWLSMTVRGDIDEVLKVAEQRHRKHLSP